MAENDEWSDDFSGISPDIGPRGDAARRLTSLRLSIGIASLGLVLALIDSALMIWGVRPSGDFMFAAGPAGLLALFAAVASVFGLGLALAGRRSPLVDSRLRTVALWESVALVAIAIVLSLVTAVYVACAVIALSLFLGVRLQS